MTFVYRGQSMYVDTNALLKALLPKYPYYDVSFHPGKPFEQIASVRIKPSLIAKEADKYRRKVDSWIYEGIVMTIIMLVLALALYFFLDRVLKINQQQNNFLLAVTHELKTPVASTKLAIQTAQRKMKNSDEQLTKLLSMADNNMSRLTKIIDNVLMATRVQSITVKTVIQDLVLEELINDIVQDIRPSLPQSSQIECHFMPDLIIRGDRELLQMAISNLISNAVKYSPEGNERVIVKTFIQKGRVAMSITDFGAGIPEKERKNIFKMFYRIGDERTRSSSGTGLGLFLVQGILRQHSAIITVNHNIPVGSSFCIVFKEKASL
jgi:signal transduction histidine kinase